MNHNHIWYIRYILLFDSFRCRYSPLKVHSLFRASLEHHWEPCFRESSVNNVWTQWDLTLVAAWDSFWIVFWIVSIAMRLQKKERSQFSDVLSIQWIQVKKHLEEMDVEAQLGQNAKCWLARSMSNIMFVSRMFGHVWTLGIAIDSEHAKCKTGSHHNMDTLKT